MTVELASTHSTSSHGLIGAATPPLSPVSKWNSRWSTSEARQQTGRRNSSTPNQLRQESRKVSKSSRDLPNIPLLSFPTSKVPLRYTKSSRNTFRDVYYEGHSNALVSPPLSPKSQPENSDVELRRLTTANLQQALEDNVGQGFTYVSKWSFSNDSEESESESDDDSDNVTSQEGSTPGVNELDAEKRADTEQETQLLSI